MTKQADYQRDMPVTCAAMGRFECPCVLGDRFQQGVPRVRHIVGRLQQAQANLVSRTHVAHGP